MFFDSLVYTIPSSSPHTPTNTVSAVILISQTSEFPFWSMKGRIVDSIVNYQLSLEERLSRKLSNGQENPAFENFILSETLKYLVDLNTMSFFLVPFL